MYTLEVYGRNVWLCGTLVCCFEKAQEACVQKCKSVVNQCKSVRKKPASLRVVSVGRSVEGRSVSPPPGGTQTRLFRRRGRAPGPTLSVVKIQCHPAPCPSDAQRSRLVLVGERLPDQDALITLPNPRYEPVKIFHLVHTRSRAARSPRSRLRPSSACDDVFYHTSVAYASFTRASLPSPRPPCPGDRDGLLLPRDDFARGLRLRLRPSRLRRPVPSRRFRPRPRRVPSGAPRCRPCVSSAAARALRRSLLSVS